MKVLEIAFTGYPVTDIARARSFYEGLLGLEVGHVVDRPEGQWVEYYLGPHTLALTNLSPDWKPSSQGAAVALEVEDFDAAVAELQAAKVSFTLPPYESPVCHMCVVKDPDGNNVTIHRRKSR